MGPPTFLFAHLLFQRHQGCKLPQLKQGFSTTKSPPPPSTGQLCEYVQATILSLGFYSKHNFMFRIFLQTFISPRSLERSSLSFHYSHLAIRIYKQESAKTCRVPPPLFSFFPFFANPHSLSPFPAVSLSHPPASLKLTSSIFHAFFPLFQLPHTISSFPPPKKPHILKLLCFLLFFFLSPPVFLSSLLSLAILIIHLLHLQSTFI